MGSGSLPGSLSAVEGPQGAGGWGQGRGRGCSPPSHLLGEKPGASSQAAGSKSGLQPSGVTGGAQPPGRGAGAGTAAPTLLCHQLPRTAGSLGSRDTPRPPGPLEWEKGGKTRQRNRPGFGDQGASKPPFATSSSGTSGQGLPLPPGGDRQAVPYVHETADQHDKSGPGGWPSCKKKVLAAHLLLMTCDYRQRGPSV